MKINITRNLKIQRDSHKKETETLRKDKIRLDEELRIAVIENRNKSDEKTTIHELFKCMREFMDKKGDQESNRANVDVNDGSNFHSCVICAFKGKTTSELQKHNNDCHKENVNFPCHSCDGQFKSRQSLNDHKKLHAKVQCSECRFTANNSEDIKEHKLRMHIEKHYCKMCDFCIDSKDKLTEHETGFHKVTSFNCS